jgi:plasmid stabilization system protein ParE
VSFVFWTDDSVDDLEDIWARASPSAHPAVSTAVAEIHDKLARDPIGSSESRTGRTRIIVELPLSALFRISADGSRVDVLHVTFWGRP